MFLKPSSVVIPTQNHDYPDWHRGRTHYGLWYISIEDPKINQYLQQLRQQFSDILFEPNQRQFHITLAVCGFLTSQPKWDDDFDNVLLEQQIIKLRDADMSAFQLHVGKMNSFDSALFIEVKMNDSLQQIREVLKHIHPEVAPLSYYPHITLGLYREAICSDKVCKRIAQQQITEHLLDVNQLDFGHYHAQTLQGPLYTHHRIRLNSK